MVQTTDRIVSTDAERYLLVYMIAVIVIITTLVIIFFVVFQKRKNKLLIEKYEQKRQFEEEISKSRLEIQEQTLKNIGWELHDNVGQLLSVANMQLNILSTEISSNLKNRLKDSQDVLKQTLSEVRSLSKSLNSDVIQNLGLEQSVENELTRFNKLNFLKANLIVKGEDNDIVDEKDQIIIFRILQEFFSNSIKHSKAKNLDVMFEYLPDELFISATDDGVGFDEETIKKGSGLINMKSRAKLIKADLDLKSLKGKGVSLTINYKKDKSN